MNEQDRRFEAEYEGRIKALRRDRLIHDASTVVAWFVIAAAIVFLTRYFAADISSIIEGLKP